MKCLINSVLALSAVFLIGGCATFQKTYVSNHLGHNSEPEKVLAVDFIPQEVNMCGPSVLKMASAKVAPEYTLDMLKQMTFREEAQGTLKADILSAARRMGLAPYRVPTISNMFEQLEADRPVIVFQNLGLSWLPAWHFSLLIGYNVEKDNVILHTGTTAASPMTFNRFIGTWERGEMWSYVIMPPREIPPHSTLAEALDNALLFEKLDKISLAQQTYKAMLKKWPDNFEPHLGLANIYYNQKQMKLAIQESQKALEKDPKHPALLYNLSLLYHEAGQKQKARTLKERTLASAPDEERDEYLRRFTF